MIVYKMSWRSCLKACNNLFLFTITTLLVTFLFYLFINVTLEELVYLILFLSSLKLLPTVLIILEYVIIEWKREVVLDVENNQLIFKYQQTEEVVDFTTIYKIEFVKRRKLDGNMMLYAWQEFFYIKIFFKDKAKILTCLTLEDNRNVFVQFNLVSRNVVVPVINPLDLKKLR